MRSFVREFFATKHDLLPGIQVAESKQELQYVLDGMFKSPTPVIYPSALGIPDLGMAKYGEGVGEPSYWVMARGADVHVKEVPQRSGGVLYLINGLANQPGFGFQPGGCFGDHIIIRGQVSVASENPASAAICKRYWQVVGKDFKKIDGYYYAGPEALRLLGQGWRLTAAVQSPPEFDVHIRP